MIKVNLTVPPRLRSGHHRQGPDSGRGRDLRSRSRGLGLPRPVTAGTTGTAEPGAPSTSRRSHPRLPSAHEPAYSPRPATPDDDPTPLTRPRRSAGCPVPCQNSMCALGQVFLCGWLGGSSVLVDQPAEDAVTSDRAVQGDQGGGVVGWWALAQALVRPVVIEMRTYWSRTPSTPMRRSSPVSRD
jgi:hypothetical protein